MSTPILPLTSRREFLFLYDIKMGNPNGDPDENRPRVLPDKTHYVTDVRLKRFIRDYLKSQDQKILVDTIEGKTTNLTGRVAEFLVQSGIRKVEGAEKIVEILLDSFIDARLFGSTFAFATAKKKTTTKEEVPQNAEEVPSEAPEQSEKSEDDEEGTAAEEEAEAPSGGTAKAKGQGKTVTAKVKVGDKVQTIEWIQPKTLTGAVQILHGEVKHKAQEVDINGTSVFSSSEDKTRGTFTTYYALRYALIAFNGIANQHSAKVSRMTDGDYDTLLKAMWYGVRSAGNTRTKRGQVPRLLVSVVYKPNQEFQFGNLTDYVKLTGREGKQQQEWASPADYDVDLSRLRDRLKVQASRIARLEYCVSPDVTPSPDFAEFKLLGVSVNDLKLDEPPAESLP